MSEIEGPSMKATWKSATTIVVNLNRAAPRGLHVGEPTEEEKKQGRKKKKNTNQPFLQQFEPAQQPWNGLQQHPQQQSQLLPQQWQSLGPPQHWQGQQQTYQHQGWSNDGYPQQQPSIPPPSQQQQQQQQQQPNPIPYFQQPADYQLNGGFQPPARAMTFNDVRQPPSGFSTDSTLPRIEERPFDHQSFEPRMLNIRSFSTGAVLDPTIAPLASFTWCISCRVRSVEERFKICGHGYCKPCDDITPNPEDIYYCPSCISSQRHRCLQCRSSVPTVLFQSCKHGFCEPCDNALPEPTDALRCDRCLAAAL